MKHIMSVENEKVITGALGSCIDRILCPIGKRRCRIIGRLGLGVKHENGTYSDILGLLQSKKVDVYLKGEQEYLNEPWLRRSWPLRTEKYGHRNLKLLLK